jgi:hypothetical protein
VDIGTPVAVVMMMVLCAPGEQHLAHLAGWTTHMAWLLSGLVVAYAGIAAVEATSRPPGAKGKFSAVLGAVVALGLAMAAQPISHLFVTDWLSASPRAPVWLIVSVSCVPPLIVGHLLHLSASRPGVSVPSVSDHVGHVLSLMEEGHVRVSEDSGIERPVSTSDLMSAFGISDRTEGRDMTAAEFDGEGQNVSDVPVVPDPDWSGGRPVPSRDEDSTGTQSDSWYEDDGQLRLAESSPVPPRTWGAGVQDSASVRVRRTADGSMTSVVKSELSRDENISDDELRDILRDRFGQDTKTNSISKAIKRAREAMSA